MTKPEKMMDPALRVRVGRFDICSPGTRKDGNSPAGQFDIDMDGKPLDRVRAVLVDIRVGHVPRVIIEFLEG